MPSKRSIITYLGLTFLAAGATPLSAQTQQTEKKEKQEEIKLNEDVIKMIQFDFIPNENRYQPLNAPMDKKWMQFKEDLSMPRSMIDSTRVKKITGYIRAEPYTIWTKFGENPVYDVMPTIEKKWKIYWNINPNQQHRGEYGRDFKPVPGETYQYVNSPAGPGVSISVDFDKLLYENLTKRGRAIKHNRTHAVAWKKYANYIPTKQDHAGLEKYIVKQSAQAPTDSTQVHDTDEEILSYDDGYLYPDNDSLKLEAPEITPAFQPMPLLPVYTSQPDSVKTDKPQKKSEKKPENKPKTNSRQPEAIPDYQRYIRQRAAEDSIRRQEFLKRDKTNHNVYDVEMQTRRLREQQN